VASIDQPAVDEPPAKAGVADLYRATWSWLREVFVRNRLTLALEIGFIAAWFLIRTRYQVDARPYLIWTVATATISLASPSAGLVILAATGPFYEPVQIGRDLGMRHVLVATLGISVAIRLVLGGWRRMPWSPPVLLAIAIGLVTALGVAITYERFDQTFAEHAARSWLSSVGGAMIILVVAVWVARCGTWRPVAAAVASGTLAVTLSVIDQLNRGLVSSGPLGWIGLWKDFGPRLGGAVPSPNGMAAVALLPLCLLAAYSVLSPQRGRAVLWRAGAATLGALLLFAMCLTFSRAALLSLLGLAIVIAWRIHRRAGQVVLVAGIVVGLALLPSYLALRDRVGASGVSEPGAVLMASDALRLQAWDSAAHMWLDEPVFGQGFLAYRQLGPTFGDQVLGSPHNEWLRLFAEEGLVGGVIGLLFVATMWRSLARNRDAIGSGILAGSIGYVLMASFNNPFLFIQVSSMVFIPIGYGLARSISRPTSLETGARSFGFRRDHLVRRLRGRVAS